MAQARLPPLVPLLDAGTVRLIATSSIQRSKLTPEVASFAEAGIDGVDIANYVGLAAPWSTPPSVVERLELATVVGTPRPHDWTRHQADWRRHGRDREPTGLGSGLARARA